jgi:hypothetical protein
MATQEQIDQLFIAAGFISHDEAMVGEWWVIPVGDMAVLVAGYGAGDEAISKPFHPAEKCQVVAQDFDGDPLRCEDAGSVDDAIKLALEWAASLRTELEKDTEIDRRAADRVDGYDRDDLGESPDY